MVAQPIERSTIPVSDSSFNQFERNEINRIGRQYGCHTCGTKRLSLPSGNFVIDRQPPTAFLRKHEEQRLLPHCITRNARQGFEIRELKKPSIASMKTVSARTAPPYSLLSVTDAGKQGDPPDWVDDVQILATSSLISIRCFPEIDGETLITLGHVGDLEVSGEPVFDQMLETPTRVVAVMEVTWDTIISLPVATARTRVRIWQNDPVWPDDIRIALG